MCISTTSISFVCLSHHTEMLAEEMQGSALAGRHLAAGPLEVLQAEDGVSTATHCHPEDAGIGEGQLGTAQVLHHTH